MGTDGAKQGDVEMGGPQPGYPPQGYPPQGPPPAGGAQPLPGYPVKAPLVPPQQGQVILSYEIFAPETGCCKCEGMTQRGLIILILLLLLFPFLACIPCCMEECFEKYQRPVYGFPPHGQGQPMPMGQPPQAYR